MLRLEGRVEVIARLLRLIKINSGMMKLQICELLRCVPLPSGAGGIQIILLILLI